MSIKNKIALGYIGNSALAAAMSQMLIERSKEPDIAKAGPDVWTDISEVPQRGITIQEIADQDKTIPIHNYTVPIVPYDIPAIQVSPREYGMNKKSRRSKKGNKW